jgi:hypothetical protein
MEVSPMNNEGYLFRIAVLEKERDFAREAVVSKCRQYDIDMKIMQTSLNREINRVAELEAALRRCQTVLGNMAEENEGAIFNRWPINHEPLRNDARNLLPEIDAALASEQDK